MLTSMLAFLFLLEDCMSDDIVVLPTDNGRSFSSLVLGTEVAVFAAYAFGC